MTTSLAIPTGLTSVSEDSDLNLDDECYCGEAQPVGTVTWHNVQTRSWDWLDVCEDCLSRAVALAWDSARDVPGEGVHLDVLPDSERTSA